jgi:hypothetical protein
LPKLLSNYSFEVKESPESCPKGTEKSMEKDTKLPSGKQPLIRSIFGDFTD